jgi:hypothetical protein
MRVKVKRTEQYRFTWNAQDYGPGDEVDIPDAYAAEYIKQAMSKRPSRRSHRPPRGREISPRLDGQKSQRRKRPKVRAAKKKLKKSRKK